ncbi:fibroblast growth factor receptor 1-A-like [Stylophora pistillata]|uniref:fibroblast growth factor receptor 1-A-like n=1 Tax=Stylophora pistillata TaxID=50429 RepID=UPI000C046E1E|nr:fibroblast growth factor receptor 1-A-like [Stylophora pistillata]
MMIHNFKQVPYIREKRGDEAKVIKVNSGKDVKLNCQIEYICHFLNPEYYWLKDNQILTPSDHQRMRLRPYRYLKIRQVKKEDAGFYTCVAVNDCGKNRYTMQLIVGAARLNEKITVAPIFTVSQGKMRRNLLAVPVGNSVKLDCSADGHPPPTVEWYKDGKLFKERKGGRKLYLSQWTNKVQPAELQKTESTTDDLTVSPTSVSSESEAVVQTSRGWTDIIRYPAAVIAVSVGMVVLLIIAFGVCYWHVRKSRASSSTTMQRRHNIASLRTTYVAQPNEYVIVPDLKRLYVD